MVLVMMIIMMISIITIAVFVVLILVLVALAILVLVVAFIIIFPISSVRSYFSSYTLNKQRFKESERQMFKFVDILQKKFSEATAQRERERIVTWGDFCVLLSPFL